MRSCRFAAWLGLILIVESTGNAAPETTTPASAIPLAAAIAPMAQSILRARDLQADVAILRHAYGTPVATTFGKEDKRKVEIVYC